LQKETQEQKSAADVMHRQLEELDVLPFLLSIFSISSFLSFVHQAKLKQFGRLARDMRSKAHSTGQVNETLEKQLSGTLERLHRAENLILNLQVRK
jgi:hypothetical protein